jgi:hypothetical protein
MRGIDVFYQLRYFLSLNASNAYKMREHILNCWPSPSGQIRAQSLNKPPRSGPHAPSPSPSSQSGR